MVAVDDDALGLVRGRQDLLHVGVGQGQGPRDVARRVGAGVADVEEERGAAPVLFLRGFGADLGDLFHAASVDPGLAGSLCPALVRRGRGPAGPLAGGARAHSLRLTDRPSRMGKIVVSRSAASWASSL